MANVKMAGEKMSDMISAIWILFKLWFQYKMTDYFQFWIKVILVISNQNGRWFIKSMKTVILVTLKDKGLFDVETVIFACNGHLDHTTAILVTN